MVTTAKGSTYHQFAARLHAACDDVGLPRPRGRATELGKLVGVGYKGASKWLDGHGMPDMGHAAALAATLGVCFEWLMTGRGPKTVGQYHAAEPRAAYAVKPLHHVNLRESIRLIEEELPPDEYHLTPDERASAIEKVYLCLKPDGSLDLRRVVEVVINPTKNQHQRAGGSNARGSKRSVAKNHP